MNLKTAKVTQDRTKLTQKSVDMATNLVLFVAPGADVAQLAPYGSAIAQRLRRRPEKLTRAEPLYMDLPNPIGTHLSLAVIDPEATPFELLAQARTLVAAHRQPPARELAVACLELGAEDAERAREAVVAAALAADFPMPHFKGRVATKPPRLRSIRLYGPESAGRLIRTIAGARGNNLARYLTALPPNELSPRTYRQRVQKLARGYGWKSEFLDINKLKARGAGAFLAVAQGSPDRDAGILHLRYEPKRRSRRPGVALVGKGVCFDTGGTNLKSAKGMHGMHEDMEGSAVALGALLALTELGVDFSVDCWLALVQNHIGPKAYRPNEVVRAADGTTIEVVHTDAEGRMILADTLILASRRRPGLIVDYATLTGACVAALSTRYSAAITNRADLVPTLIEAGRASGERVWPFPLDADFGDPLKSDVADIKQCVLESEADHILAAVFLRRFIADDLPWVHVDLAAGNHKGGLAHVPTDITGFGVRFTLALLLDHDIPR